MIPHSLTHMLMGLDWNCDVEGCDLRACLREIEMQRIIDEVRAMPKIDLEQRIWDFRHR